MLELADAKQVAPELAAHADACRECAAELAALRATMSALGAWQAPEPSPYFDARLRARLREMPAPRLGWLGSLEWLRKPALATAMSVLLFSAVVLFQGGPGPDSQGPKQIAMTAEPGTAVADLQALDRNAELFSDFELLDEVEVEEVNQ
jgi:hypothetical protein